MWALYKLQARAYFANIFARVDFITTVIFLMVLGSIASFGISQGLGGDLDPLTESSLWAANISIISSITILMVMNSALYAFGFSFFEMKDSVLLKRIGATNISKSKAIISFLSWGSTTMVFTVAWIGVWVGIFQIPGVATGTNGLLYVGGDIWKNVNWGGVVVAILVTSISFYAIAFLFVSISKNSEMYNITTTFYFFFVAFLGGAFTPNAGRDWMTYVSYLSPLGWASEMMQHSMAGADVFQLGGYDMLIGYDGILGSEPIYNHIDALHASGHIVFPVLYGVLAGLASLKLFKWD